MKKIYFKGLLLLGIITILSLGHTKAAVCQEDAQMYDKGGTAIRVCPVAEKDLFRSPLGANVLNRDYYGSSYKDKAVLSTENNCISTLLRDVQQDLRTKLLMRSYIQLPYGIARWNGQCTTNSLTLHQLSNESCVKKVRANKLLILMSKESTLDTSKLYVCSDPSRTSSIAGEELKSQVKKSLSSMRAKYAKKYKIVPKDVEKLAKANEGDPIDLEYGEFTYRDTLISNVAPGVNNEFSINYKNQVLFQSPEDVGYNFDHSWNKYIINGEGGLTFLDGSLSAYDFPGGYSKVLNAKIENNGDGYSITFDADNSEMYFQDVNGDGTYKITKREMNNGLSYDISYNEIGKVTTVSDTLGRITMFSYNFEYGRLEQVTDPYGRAVFFDYYMGITNDGLTGDLKSITVFHDGEYKTTSFAYDTSVSYEYDDEGNIIEVIVDHVKSHNMKRMVDAKGVVYVTNVYDANDRVVAQTYGNHTLNYSYQLNGDAVVGNTVTNRKGQVTNYAFDSNGNTTSFTAGGVTYRYTYDADSQLLVELLPNGNATRYEYNSKGHVTNVTQTDGVETITQSYTYTTDGKIATATTPDNIQTTYTYSPGGLVQSQSAKPLDNSKSSIGVNYTYNYRNLIDTVSLPDGQKVKYTYNENDQIIKVERSNMNGEKIVNLINYDQYGNPISMSDGEGNVTQLGYNARDQVKQVTSPSGIKQYFEYDKTNNLTKASTLLENGAYAWQSMSYDILDNPVSIEYNSHGSTTSKIGVGYDQNENAQSLVNPKGIARNYEYDAFQMVTKKYAIINTNGISQKIVYIYEYDEVGNIIKISNPRGYETNIEHNWLGQVTKVTNNQGTYALATYDSKYRLASTEMYDKNNKLLQKTTNTYDSWGNMVTESQNDVLLSTRQLTTTLTYDNFNKLTEVKDPKGGTTNYTYDGFGRNESIEDPLGNLKTNLYNNNDQVVAQITTTAEGKTLATYNDYDREGRLLKSTNHVGYTDSFTYNNLNQLVSTSNREGNKTIYKQDYIGNTVQSKGTSADTTNSSNYTYDQNNNLTSLTDANGNKTIFVYDQLDRQTKKILPDGSISVYWYDQNNNLIKRTDPNGNTVVNSFDSLDRLIDRKITLGTNVGGVTSEHYEYDALGRLIESNDSQNNKLTFEYNGLGSLISETNNGKTVRYVNNNRNDLSEIIYPSGKKIAYNYDVVGRLAEISEGSLQAEGSITPDLGVGKLIINNIFDGATLQKTVYGNTTETNYKYDSLLRLKELSHINFKTPAPMDSIDYTFTYDKENNIVQNGVDTYWYDKAYKLTNVAYNNGSLVKRQNGELIKGSQTSTDYNQRQQERNYDNIGNRKTEFNNVPGIAIKEDITGRSNSAYVVSNDIEGKMVKGDEKGENGINGKISDMLSFGNNAATKSKESGKLSLVVGSSLQAKGGGGGGGNGNSSSKGNGKGMTNVKTNGNANYNGKGADSGLKKGRDKTAKNNALKGRCQWKSSGKGATPSKCKGVTYEALVVSGSQGYIDGIPNLFTGQKPVVPNDKVVYNSNNLNQYTSVAYGTSSINLKYDRNGNMIENEKFIFQYDYKNRLIKATAKPAVDDYLVDTFTYDTLGRRLTKWMDTKSNVGRYIKYVYSNENAIEEEWFYNIGEGREQTKEYIYGQGTDDVVKVYIEKQGLRNEQRFYKDNQGSVVAIADEYGKIVESYRYDAFGNLILGYQSNSIKFNLSPSDKNAQTNTANGSKSWITNSRLYTAREYDQELDLYYYRGRSYDARMGRFIQRDPIGYADDVNLYTYVGNNPMNFVDPRGLVAKALNPLMYKLSGIIDINKLIHLKGSILDYEIKRYQGIYSEFSKYYNILKGYTNPLYTPPKIGDLIKEAKNVLYNVNLVLDLLKNEQIIEILRQNPSYYLDDSPTLLDAIQRLNPRRNITPYTKTQDALFDLINKKTDLANQLECNIAKQYSFFNGNVVTNFTCVPSRTKQNVVDRYDSQSTGTQTRIDGAFKVVIGGIDILVGVAEASACIGSIETGPGAIPVCIIFGGKAINDFIAGGSSVYVGFVEIYTGEPSSILPFNPLHYFIEKSIENKTTAFLTTLGIELAIDPAAFAKFNEILKLRSIGNLSRANALEKELETYIETRLKANKKVITITPELIDMAKEAIYAQSLLRNTLSAYRYVLNEDIIKFVRNQDEVNLILSLIRRGSSELDIGKQLIISRIQGLTPTTAIINQSTDIAKTIRNDSELDMILGMLTNGNATSSMFEQLMVSRLRELYPGSNIDTIRSLVQYQGEFKVRYPDAKILTINGQNIMADFKLGYRNGAIDTEQLADYLQYGAENKIQIKYYFSSLEGLTYNESKIIGQLRLDDRYASLFEVFYIDNAGNMIKHTDLIP